MGEQRSFKVGDVVAWADVPIASLVRRGDPNGVTWHIVRNTNGRGVVVGAHDEDGDGAWWSCGSGAWEYWGENKPMVTIVALGLSCTEAAGTLQALASAA